MEKVREITKERKFKYICFFWSIISIQFIIGKNMETTAHFFDGWTYFFVDIIKFLFMTITFIAIHYCILELIKKVKKKNKKETKINPKYKWPIYFLIIFVCWIPTVLAFYPSILGYDGGYQIKKYFFLNQIPHHPILITKLYTFFYVIGLKMNSPSFGMFLFSLTQMSFMAGVFSYTVKFIEEQTDKKWIRNISIIFYALYPYNQLFAITTTKDVIMAGLMLIFLIYLYKMLEEKYKIADYAFFIIIGVLMLLSRNNSIYTLKVSLPLIILILIKERYKLIKVVGTFLLIIIIYQSTNSFLYKIMNSNLIEPEIEATNDEGNMRMSIFSQAVGRVACLKKDSLTEEEKEKISYYFNDFEKLSGKYRYNIADDTVRLVNSENVNKNKKEFFRFIIELGKKYPLTYIESFLDTTRGYWYIRDTSFSRVMTFGHPGAFELYDFGVSKGKYKVIHDSKLPKLKQMYIDLYQSNNYQKIPVLYVLFQPGIFFYFTFAFLLYAIYKKEKNILVIATVLFTFYASCYMAFCSIIRYMYPAMVSAPLMLAFANKNKEKVH